MAHDPHGFIRYPRTDSVKRSVAERIADWGPVYTPQTQHALTVQATRCMDCGVAFCHAGCPLANLIPEWNELVARGDWHSALENLHSTNNFPEFTGWICPAPCEAACVLSINSAPVSIKQIERAIIESDASSLEPQAVSNSHRGRIAVIGSGPAGLTVAQQLTRVGYRVTVFERDNHPGGLLRYGIPDFKFPKSVLDRRLEQLYAENIEFLVNHPVTPENIGQIQQEFDAIVLSVGALEPREVAVPGRNLAGIHQAMEYLKFSNKVQAGELDSCPIDTAGKHVVIVGGGDTAADCLGTAHRQGALSVTIVDHNRPPTPLTGLTNPQWPTAPHLRGQSPAHEEGGQLEWRSQITEFLADSNGSVCGVSVQQVQVDSAEGKRIFTAIPDTKVVLPATIVLLATGFVGTDSLSVLEALKVEQHQSRSTAVVDNAWQTSAPGVFACGDATRGASLVVWAIAEGRACAAAVDQYLSTTSNLTYPVTPGALPL